MAQQSIGMSTIIECKNSKKKDLKKSIKYISMASERLGQKKLSSASIDKIDFVNQAAPFTKYPNNASSNRNYSKSQS